MLTGVRAAGLLVAMKLRAESGYPTSTFFFNYDKGQTLLFRVHGVRFPVVLQSADGDFLGIMFTMIFFNHSCFALVPGMQVELVALGDRLKGANAVTSCWRAHLALSGGMVVGGWVYLSGAYAVGAI